MEGIEMATEDLYIEEIVSRMIDSLLLKVPDDGKEITLTLTLGQAIATSKCLSRNAKHKRKARENYRMKKKLQDTRLAELLKYKAMISENS